MSFSKAAAAATIVLGWATPAAAGATTPGWECIPTTAGQAVVSGGTGAVPSCSSGTPVLAPTYVSSGVGGKPTVEFSTVNVQILSGSGSTTGAVNGVGNLVLGYAENANSYTRTGSHDLIVGPNHGWSGYSEIVGGNTNQATGNFATVVGKSNVASGGSSFAAGETNLASGGAATVAGGAHNNASGTDSGILGGLFNLANDRTASIAGGCRNLTGPGSTPSGTCSASGTEAVLGGFGNRASGLEATVSGGETNTAANNLSSILGGEGNTSSANCQAIPAAPIGTC